MISTRKIKEKLRDSPFQIGNSSNYLSYTFWKFYTVRLSDQIVINIDFCAQQKASLSIYILTERKSFQLPQFFYKKIVSKILISTLQSHSLNHPLFALFKLPHRCTHSPHSHSLFKPWSNLYPSPSPPLFLAAQSLPTA